MGMAWEQSQSSAALGGLGVLPNSAPQGAAAPQVGGPSQEFCEVSASSVTQDVQGQRKIGYPAPMEKEKEEENETEKRKIKRKF